MSEFDTGPRSTRASVLIPFAIVTLIWGSTWLVIRDQISVVPATWSVSYRFLVGGLAMGAFALAKRESFRLGTTGWLFAAGIGLFQFVLNFNFVYRAEAYITSGLVAVVFAMLLIPNAGFARLFLGQRMGRQLLIGSGIAMAGAALLFVHEARVDPAGPARALTGIVLTIVAVLSASTASALAFPLYYRVLRTIGPAKAAYSSVIVPVIAMSLSTVFEGYRWSLLASAGAGVTALGLVIALKARRPNR